MQEILQKLENLAGLGPVRIVPWPLRLFFLLLYLSGKVVTLLVICVMVRVVIKAVFGV